MLILSNDDLIGLWYTYSLSFAYYHYHSRTIITIHYKALRFFLMVPYEAFKDNLSRLGSFGIKDMRFHFKYRIAR